ncbi:transposase [Sphingomonas sp. 37zxx]|uniref:transposase n=1 Tax=Sphingomonas sp. 37zxx TaxID=1550073 RepID=UPI002F3F42ED
MTAPVREARLRRQRLYQRACRNGDVDRHPDRAQVRRSNRLVVHPRRWVVERTFAWLNRNRRLAKDFEQSIRSATAFLYAASAMLLIRRLARYA